MRKGTSRFEYGRADPLSKLLVVISCFSHGTDCKTQGIASDGVLHIDLRQSLHVMFSSST
jgi:hypothetical protein